MWEVIERAYCSHIACSAQLANALFRPIKLNHFQILLELHLYILLMKARSSAKTCNKTDK